VTRPLFSPIACDEGICPDAAQLAAFIDGSAATRCACVARHLCECDACRALLVALLLTGASLRPLPVVH
jgi:hypothetical protein